MSEVVTVRPDPDVEVRSAYGPRLKVALAFDPGVDLERSLTRQSEKTESDINVIVARYKATGYIANSQARQPSYLDVSNVVDYRAALEQVRESEAFFAGMSAEVRAHFKNDSAAFIEALGDPSRRVELEEFGITEKSPGDSVPGSGVQGRDPVTGQFTAPVAQVVAAGAAPAAK